MRIDEIEIDPLARTVELLKNRLSRYVYDTHEDITDDFSPYATDYFSVDQISVWISELSALRNNGDLQELDQVHQIISHLLFYFQNT
jgi:hypothetical protein